MGQLIRRVWYAIRQRRFEADLSEEMEFHRAMKQRDLEDQGLETTEARFATRRALGSIALARDRSRDVWCPLWLQGIGQDFRLAVRTLLASRIVATVAVLSLALGIGANTAIFSLINSLLLKPLPVHEPDRLVALGSDQSPDDVSVNYTIWKQIRDRGLLADGFAWAPDSVNTSNAGETAFVDAIWASGRFFDVLGVPAIAGRTFSDVDDRRGGGSDGPVAVISYGFWQRGFGGASNVIGRTLTLARVRFKIVGILPPSFFGLNVGSTFDVVLPLETEPLIGRIPPRLDVENFPWLHIMARLTSEDSVDETTANLRRVQPQIRQTTMPSSWTRAEDRDAYLQTPWAARPASTGSSRLRSQYAFALLSLLAIAALVLLVACVNIANLQLARIVARRYEFSVRVALGASRMRIGRLLLVESLVLSAIGAALGFAFAQWGSRLLVSQLSTWAYIAVLDLSPDWRVLGVTGMATIATAVLFGTLPALRATRAEPIEALKKQPRGVASDSTAGAAGPLVVAQVALSLVLLVAAGLFLRSFVALAFRDLGFDRARVLVAVVDARRSTFPAESRAALYERVREAAAVVPDVESAATSMATPLGSAGVRFTPDISGPDSAAFAGRDVRILTNPVSPDWFRTFGTRLLAGRDFETRDRPGATEVVIVNETFARRYFDGANPIGRTLVESTGPADRHQLEIVGLVEDAAFTSVRDPLEPTLYRPLAQLESRWLTSFPSISVSVRMARASSLPQLRTGLAAAIGNVDPNLSVTFRTVSEQLDYFYIRERLLAQLSGFFGGVALLLAALGLYGMAAYAVASRRKEIGIRMALGATPARVISFVLARVFLMIGVGMVAGVGISLWASTLIASLLYGLEPRDPATLIEAAVVIAAAAVLAAWLPAWRASRTDPAVVLRYE